MQLFRQCYIKLHKCYTSVVDINSALWYYFYNITERK